MEVGSTAAAYLQGSFAVGGGDVPVDPSRSPFPCLDNGADELVLDAHCNTAAVRWSLREHGLVLAGTHEGASNESLEVAVPVLLRSLTERIPEPGSSSRPGDEAAARTLAFVDYASRQAATRCAGARGADRI